VSVLSINLGKIHCADNRPGFFSDGADYGGRYFHGKGSKQLDILDVFCGALDIVNVGSVVIDLTGGGSNAGQGGLAAAEEIILRC
jgi:hypothetical protein